MSVVKYADLAAQYPAVRESGIAAGDAEQHIQFAQAEIEGILSPYYTVPFSDDNLTAKDLVLRLSYSRIAPLSLEERGKVREEVIGRLERLTSGKEQMLTTSGTLSQDAASAAWSSTEDYHPIFTIDNPINWVVDSRQIEDIRDERDN